MEYGLIGFPLKHSFSKEVHSLFSNYKYDICELEENNFDAFIREKNFKGINVTIPYKQKVIPYLDKIDSFAKDINAVNTIVNNKGSLIGYNTDFYGIVSSFAFFNCFDKNYHYIILGTGATSNTLEYSLRFLGATNIKKCYRENSKIKGDILYKDLENEYADKDLFIINATPNGMYPHMDEPQLIDLKKFKNLKGIFDVVYNPLRTNLLIEAEKLNIKAFSGLYMLVAQAIFAGRYFTNDNIKNDPFHFEPALTALKDGDLTKADDLCDNALTKGIEKYYNVCYKNKLNIVLSGMPTCGKSTLGKIISEKYGYEFVDTDKLIENKINDNISNFIKENGEEKFRDVESEVIKEISTKNHSVISTGGGAILRNENVINLKHNGKIFFINRSLELLKPTSDRPLTSNVDDLKKKYDERLSIYKSTSDVEIDGDVDYNDRISNIIKNR